MTRLIDADALMPSFVQKAFTMQDRHGVKLGENWLLDYNDIKDVIDNAPTVEPEKVVVANVTFDEDKLKEIVQREVIDKIKSGELVIQEERPQVAYLCKYHKEPHYCKHTTRIEDAMNFVKLEDGKYMEVDHTTESAE